MTGGFLRPSVSNAPLPRLKPQPLAITRMIGKRRDVREKRILKLVQLQETIRDIRWEAEFEQGLAKLVGQDHKFDPVFGEHVQEWCNILTFLGFRPTLLIYVHSGTYPKAPKRD